MFLESTDAIHHYEEKHTSILQKGEKVPTRTGTPMGKGSMKKVKDAEREDNEDGEGKSAKLLYVLK